MAEKIKGKTALIFGAVPSANWDYLKDISPDLVICADGGVLCARQAGLQPDLLIGDWDSGGQPVEGIPSISLPPDKDLTDLQAAAEEAMKHGCHRLLFCCCLGGRLDQTAANLSLLEWVHDQGSEAILLDDGNEARFWDCFHTELKLKRDDRYRYLSIIPLDRKVEGVTLRGLKYPLIHGTLTRGDTLTVSNEIVEDTAVFTGEHGCCLIIRSRRFLKD